MEYALEQEQLKNIERVLREDLIALGVHSVLLIDIAGNIIAELDNGETNHDVYSLAALAAGNFGAVSAMAEIIGEGEFSLLFHRGEKENIHFSKLMKDFLLVTIFGHETSLGFLRLKAAESIGKIEEIMQS
ncbi:MAG: roadblock/LC7 domain-containing protein [Thermodesulfobacteriota bacterium]|nr:roadblock/LC7 domain-containing protein [Thermodesulfobacteriota bacterium]